MIVVMSKLYVLLGNIILRCEVTDRCQGDRSCHGQRGLAQVVLTEPFFQ